MTHSDKRQNGKDARLQFGSIFTGVLGLDQLNQCQANMSYAKIEHIRSHIKKGKLAMA